MNKIDGYFTEINSSVTDVLAKKSGADIKEMKVLTRIAPEFISISAMEDDSDAEEGEKCLCLMQVIEGRIQVLVWESSLLEDDPILVQDLGESGTMVPSVKLKSHYSLQDKP